MLNYLEMDVEKTMEFILAVQSRLESSVEKHAHLIAKHDEQIAKLEHSMTALSDLVGRLAQSEIHLVERVENGFKEMRALQADTEGKLNALISTVDKLVRRNGHKE